MAKKHTIEENETTSHIIATPLEDIMGDRFGRYSKYIIQDRALPDARDGLKPVQRRILYAMHEEGNTYDKGYRKSAKTVGIVIGNYHPHGDTSVYDAMVRMSQEWKIRTPQIDMQGNNGSIDDDPAAAMRYTEARLSHISDYLLKDIDKDTVLWAPNYDDTAKEPTVLPARYPNLLVNGITGIAAGYATNIPPHNLEETIDATIYRIQHPNATLEELMQFVKGPDFPTGGIVQGKQGIKDAFTTGKGRIMIRSKVSIEQTKTNQQIIIHEIPYEVVKSNMVKKIDDVRLNKKIDGILDVRDESDRNGLRIVVDIKKDVNAQLILNYLYKNTDLQVSYNYNVIAIVNKRPVQMGLSAMLDAFIAHREDVIYRRSQFELDKKEKRCHILEGLIKAISVLDEIIALIRSAKDKADSKQKIIEKFAFTEEQAEAIVTMRLYRLSNTDVTLLKEEFAQLLNEIETLHDIINNPKTLRKVMVKELKEVRKEFHTPRLTAIEDEIEEIVIDKVQMINNEKVMMTLSKDGYAKRVSLRSYSASSDSLTGMKEGDQLIGCKEVNTLDHVLFFTNKGTYGYLPVYEIEEGKWKDTGTHVNSRLKMSSDEKINDCFIVKNFQTYAFIISISEKGLIKKTLVSEYEVSRNNKTMLNMKLTEDDQVIRTLVAYEHDEIVLLSKNGYVSRYPVSFIPNTSNKSKGVKAMNLMEDVLVDAGIIQDSSSMMAIFTQSRAMKRLKLSDIEATGRPARGTLICKRVKSNPQSMQTLFVGGLNDSLYLIDEETTKIAMKDVALMSKDATFSTAMKLSESGYFFRFNQEVQQIELPKEEEKRIDIEESKLDLF